MRNSLQIGKAFGIPVHVHWSFLLLPVLVAFRTAGDGLGTVAFMMAFVLAVFACVLLHEFGHALMARYFGIGTRDITLYPIGGVASLQGLGKGPAQEVAIALAGPAVNLVLLVLLSPAVLIAAVTGALTATTGAWSLTLKFLALLGLSNLVLLAFNLLPAFPMDGGRVLRALLSIGMTRLRATEIAAAVGLVMAGLFLVAAYLLANPMLAVLAVFVGFLGQRELWALRRLERPVTVEDIPMPLFPREYVGEPKTETVRITPLYPWSAQAPEPSAGPPRGFTGLALDPRRGVLVRWQDGQPVEVIAG